MILGRGLIANALSVYDRQNFIFYVNGISNSSITHISETNNHEIIELGKILEECPDKVLIYFSTCMVNSIDEFTNSYITHKYNIELFIKQNFQNYLIVRTSNLVGNNTWNNNTLFNFLANSIKSESEIVINKTMIRNILDVDDFAYILDKYLIEGQKFNTVIDLVYPRSYSMNDIIIAFEKSFNKKFNFKETNKGIFAYFNADLSLSTQMFSKYRQVQEEDYISWVVNKYYIQNNL
jgi:hypothetical protein